MNSSGRIVNMSANFVGKLKRTSWRRVMMNRLISNKSENLTLDGYIVLGNNKSNLATKRAENDRKMTPQNDPKSSKNRCQKMIKMLIDIKTNFAIHFGRPGGMRWPPGGIIGGAKDSLFEICRYLRQIMASRFWRCWLSI